MMASSPSVSPESTPPADTPTRITPNTTRSSSAMSVSGTPTTVKALDGDEHILPAEDITTTTTSTMYENGTNSEQERATARAQADVLLLSTMEMIWQNYLKTGSGSGSGDGDDEDEDVKEKQHWLQLFLHNYQFVRDDQLVGDAATQRFFSLIPEEVCSYLLERVYEIISAATGDRIGLLEAKGGTAVAASGLENGRRSETADARNHSPRPLSLHLPDRERRGQREPNIQLLRKRHNFAQLILNAPSDCNKIVALRTFLTHQIGHQLLAFLLRVDIKLVASQKSLCNLCVNLFPNCAWGKTTSPSAIGDQDAASPLLSSAASIFSYVGNLCCFEHALSPVHKPRHHLRLKLNNNPQDNHRPSDYYKEDEGGASSVKNSDEIADLLVRLLIKCVRNECETTLTEQSMSVTALNFALDALGMRTDAFVGGQRTAGAIKLQLLQLVEVCLNNLLAHAENIVAIEFDYVFAKLSAALESNQEAQEGGSPDSSDLAVARIQYALIFLILGVLHNLVSVYSSRRCTTPRGRPIVDAPIVAACVRALLGEQLRHALSVDLELQEFFVLIWRLLLRIIDNLGVYEQQQHGSGTSNASVGAGNGLSGRANHGGARVARLRNVRYIRHAQQHCQATHLLTTSSADDLNGGQDGLISGTGAGSGGTRLSCFCQGLLMQLLPQLNMSLQASTMRYLLRAGTCCCHYSLRTYAAGLRIAATVGVAQQRIAYKFLHRKILETLFARAPCNDTDLGAEMANGVAATQQPLATTAPPRQLRRSAGQHHHHGLHHPRQQRRQPPSLPRHEDGDDCAHCDAKFRSPEFHTGLLKLLRQQYAHLLQEAATTAPGTVVSTLANFLKHLKNIAPLLTYDIAAGVLAEIVLPIFRHQKAQLAELSARNEREDDGRESSSHLLILHACLRIFAAYLCDIRLIKAFYVEENVAHLADLLKRQPQLMRAVCDLIRIGIDAQTFLGENALEQTTLSRRLITLQLTSSDRVSQLFHSVVQRLSACLGKSSANDSHGIRFWLLEEPTENGEDNQLDTTGDPHVEDQQQRRLSALDILHIAALQWQLNVELLKTSRFFYNEFAKIYSIVHEEDDQSRDRGTSSMEDGVNKSGSASTRSSTKNVTGGSVGDCDKTILDILRLNYNALCSFLMMLPPATQVPSQRSQSMPMIDSTTNTTADNDTDGIVSYNAFVCLSSSLEAFAITPKPSLLSPMKTRSTRSSWPPPQWQPLFSVFDYSTTGTEPTKSAAIETFATDQFYELHLPDDGTTITGGDHQFDSESSRSWQDPLHGSFLPSLKSLRDTDEEESFLIFDIRQQCRPLTDRTEDEETSTAATSHLNSLLLNTSTNSGDWSLLSTSTSLANAGNRTAYSAEAAPTAAHTAVAKVGSWGLFSKIFNIVGTLFSPSTSAAHTPTANAGNKAEAVSPTEQLPIIDEELRECFFGGGGEGKKLLLKLFEATMVICVKGYQNEEVEKMQRHLSKLKALILDSAGDNWEQRQSAATSRHWAGAAGAATSAGNGGSRDNAVLQALQTLLRIAEMSQAPVDHNRAAGAGGGGGARARHRPSIGSGDSLRSARTPPARLQRRRMRSSIGVGSGGRSAETPPPTTAPAFHHRLHLPADEDSEVDMWSDDDDDDDDDNHNNNNHNVNAKAHDDHNAEADDAAAAGGGEIDYSDLEAGVGCGGGSLTADEGYEADGEVPEAASDTDADAEFTMTAMPITAAAQHASGNGDRVLGTTRTIPTITATTPASGALNNASEMWQSLAPTSRYRTHVLHAGLCRLVIEILVELSLLCVRRPHAAWCSSLSQLANRLFVVRDCLGGPLFLLRGFAPLLRCNDTRLMELQQAILELVTELQTPEALCAYFSLLAAPKPPVDVLMKYGSHICLAGLRQPQPCVELQFPVWIDGKCVSTAERVVSEHIDRVRSGHLQAHALTPFTRSPCFLPLTHTRLWAPDGFTVSLWLQVNDSAINSMASGGGGGGGGASNAAPRSVSAAALTAVDEDEAAHDLNGATTTNQSNNNNNNHNNNTNSGEWQKTHIISVGTSAAMLSVYVNSDMRLVFETHRPNAERQVPPTAIPQPQTATAMNSSSAAEGAASSSTATAATRGSSPSPFRHALQQTKLVLLHSFSQMHLFQPSHPDSNSGAGLGMTALNQGGTGAGQGAGECASVELRYLRLTRHKWTHLAFSVAVTSDHQLEVGVHINALEEHRITLPFRQLRQLLRAAHSFQVIALGDGVSMTTSGNGTPANSTSTSNSTLDGGQLAPVWPPLLRCSVSTLVLFNRRIDQRQTLLHLTALGPDCGGGDLTPCQVGGPKPNYGLLSVQLLQRGGFGSHAEALRVLRDARVLSYTAQQPDMVMVYEAGSGGGGGATEMDGGRPRGLLLYAELMQRPVQSLQTAVTLSGGLGTLLYQFARVVELGAQPAAQALALDMLLRVAHTDAHLYGEFVRGDMLALIGSVVRTERCSKDVQLLRCLVNVACTQPLLTRRSGATAGAVYGSTEALQVNDNTTACVVHPRLLVAVLQRYSDWQRCGAEQSHVLDALLASLLALTRDKHPHRDFNMEQLSRAGCVRALLNLCKVHLVEAQNPVYVSPRAARIFAAVLTQFAGNPPSVSLMDEIMKLLLLLQRPSDCFVTHDRAHFYFLLAEGSPAVTTTATGTTAAATGTATTAPTTSFGRVASSLQRSFASRLQSRPGAARAPATAAGEELDPERKMRIERLRRLHQRNGGTAHRRTLNELEETLERVADCTALNRNALHTLSPVAVSQWRQKFKRVGTHPIGVYASTGTPTTTTLYRQRGGGTPPPKYWPWQRGSPRQPLRRRSVALGVCCSVASPRSPGKRALAATPRVARKRLRLHSANTINRILGAGVSAANVGGSVKRPRRAGESIGAAGTTADNGCPSGGGGGGGVGGQLADDVFTETPTRCQSGLGGRSFYTSVGVHALQESLFTLLKEALPLLADYAAEEVLRHYVRVDLLLVLANHSNCAVRAAITRLLAALTRRLPAVDVQAHCKAFYAQHIANQLSIHMADASLLLACTEWVTGVVAQSPEDVLAAETLHVQQRFGLHSLLAVSAKTAAAQAMDMGGDGGKLTTLAFRVLHKILVSQPEEQQALVDAGLTQCCLNALHNLYRTIGGGDGAAEAETAILDVLMLLGERSLKSPGQINLVWDILSLLTYYQDSRRHPAALALAFRSSQAFLQLNWLQLFLATPSTPSGEDGATIANSNDAKTFALRPLADCTLSANEQRTRFELLIDRSTQFFTAHESEQNTVAAGVAPGAALFVTDRRDSTENADANKPPMPSRNEVRFFQWLVLYSIAVSNQRTSSNNSLSSFISWGLLPSRPREMRAFIVDTLWEAANNRDSLPALICDGKMVRSLLLLCLLEDLPAPIERLGPLCAQLGISELDSTSMRFLHAELDRIRQNQRTLAERQRLLSEKVAMQRFEALATSCIESSMVLTRRVAEMQNAERKLITGSMKEDDAAHTYARWLEVVRRMTHEGAAWYAPEHAEKSWELDDTEGPSRVHTRLRRCHLDIDRRFFMTDYRDGNTAPATPVGSDSPRIVGTPNAAPPVSFMPNTPSTTPAAPPTDDYRRPLDYLLSSYDQQLSIALNSQILYNFQAKYLPVDGEIDGELVVTEQKLYFVATYRCKYFYVSCDLASISEVWLKRYQHQEKAFELFLDTNRSLLFSLQHEADARVLRDVLFGNKIVTSPSSPLLDASKLQAITQQWREGLLTNWEYLMTLNQLAGRTYNDLMQYPVFPWILSNYSGEMLDLTAAANFRRLHRPIAVQHDHNEQHYVSNYNYINSTMTMGMGSLVMKPYHYSSHYSNSGTVLHFLVRVPPFTSYFLRYQDNNFDLPDRTFHALNTTWNLASRDSPTDVKELIPEFFCLPEMFQNFERLNFGCRQSGERVEDVLLPPWCARDARLFILIHRQALESEMVRYHLHQWIDLIFGHKQTGEAAIEAINVFHPATYSMFLESAIEDPIERKAVETMVRTYGQMPRQLFRNAHPASKPLNYNLTGAREVLTTVHGLRWGIYAGSPQLPPPELGNIHKLDGTERLVAFPSTNVVYALRARETVMQGADVDTLNVVSWWHEDRVVRIEPLSKLGYGTRARNLLHDHYHDEITACGSDPNCNQLWFGHKSGRISVYKCQAAAGGGLDGGGGGLAAGAGSRRASKSRGSYVLSLRLSYNSAFRKMTASKAKTPTGDGDADDDDGVIMGLSSADAQSAGGAAAGSGAGGGGSGSGGGSGDLLHRDTGGADLSWQGPTFLLRHADEVTCIVLSVEFKVAVSAGRDGIAVIWDLNDWRYVRTIERPAEIHHSPITLLAISSTLGDIVSVHTIPQQRPQPGSDETDGGGVQPQAGSAVQLADECFEVTEENLDDFVNVSVNPNGKSILRLHTVNARYVQHVVHEENITAVCYSYIKEGVGVNCIATAIEGGIVRLWSSWNLSYIGEIGTGLSGIRSIAYSTHQHLVVLSRESYIQVWESEGLCGSAPKLPQVAYK